VPIPFGGHLAAHLELAQNKSIKAGERREHREGADRMRVVQSHVLPNGAAGRHANHLHRTQSEMLD
jgi:hypothetical protein